MRAKNLIYRIAAAPGARSLIRQLHRRLLPDAITAVLYHGVIDRPLPVPSPLFLPVERFARHMEYLARHFTILHVEEALSERRPRGGRPVACVTFDDGLGSLHDLALPILERLSIPATVYLVTDLVDSDGDLWHTRLHQTICETTATEVSFGNRRLPLATTWQRAVASDVLQDLLKVLPKAQFASAFAEVLERLGISPGSPPRPWPPMRVLRREEIRRMSRGDLVRFGSHTASHQILTRTDPADARREIRTSVAAVAAMVERPSRTFAYPNGGPDDFDEGTIAALREAGLAYGVTTIEGSNARVVDPYRIRRYVINAADHPSRFYMQVHHGRGLADLLSGHGAPERRFQA
jgi:peptidoglycan/xylan/chitin deacetylase (PgdA/CDA1 family)